MKTSRIYAIEKGKEEKVNQKGEYKCAPKFLGLQGANAKTFVMLQRGFFLKKKVAWHLLVGASNLYLGLSFDTMCNTKPQSW